MGDDWQSIYRFSGGDIKIIVKQYDQYFGKREMVDLGLTYRFNDRLCELTSSFILKNKDGQLHKKIRGRQDYNEIPLSIFKQATNERSRFKINFSLKIHLLKVLDKIFKEAGFEWRDSGCSMCLAMNADKLKAGERCASTSNRNFEGRQGKGGRSHLMSPIMAAAAAVTGHLIDVRELI